MFSIAGLGLSLAGFSGVVLAFRRGSTLEAVDTFRLRQLPEMALAPAFLALGTIPLADTITNARAALQVASGLGLAFTVGHIFGLITRAREQNVVQPVAFMAAAGLVDLLLLVTAAIGLSVVSVAAYEWVLLLMLARPALAFVFALSRVTSA